MTQGFRPTASLSLLSYSYQKIRRKKESEAVAEPSGLRRPLKGLFFFFLLEKEEESEPAGP